MSTTRSHPTVVNQIAQYCIFRSIFNLFVRSKSCVFVVLWSVLNLLSGQVYAQVDLAQIEEAIPLPKLQHHSNNLYDIGTWSHDGTRIAFLMHDFNLNNTHTIWIHDLTSGAITQLTYPDTIGCHDYMPDWSPDDSQIVFSSNRGNESHLYTVSLADRSLKKISEKLEINPWYLRPTWSPDGTRIAFSDKRDENIDIYVMTLSDANITRITKDPGKDTNPKWSPDGEILSFVSDRGGTEKDNIWLFEFGSGVIEKLMIDKTNIQFHTWSHDGEWIAVTNSTGMEGKWEPKSWIVPSTGGDAYPVENMVNPSKTMVWWPSWSPDGNYLAYSTMKPIQNWADISLFDVATGNQTILVRKIASTGWVDGNKWCSWSPDGEKIAYSTPVENQSGEARADTSIFVLNLSGPGDPQWVAKGRRPSWSSDGAELNFITMGEEGGKLSTYRLSSGQIEFPLGTIEGRTKAFEISSDGELVAHIRKLESSEDVWVYDRITGENIQLTFDGNEKNLPVWSPSGENIAYMQKKNAAWNIHYVPAFGGESVQLTKMEKYWSILPLWSTLESERIYYAAYSGRSWHLWTTAFEGIEEFIFAPSRAYGQPFYMTGKGEILFVNWWWGKRDLGSINIATLEEKFLTTTGDVNWPVASGGGDMVVFQKANWDNWADGALQIQDVSNITGVRVLP